MLCFPFKIKEETTKSPTKRDLKINPALGVRPAIGLTCLLCEVIVKVCGNAFKAWKTTHYLVILPLIRDLIVTVWV